MYSEQHSKKDVMKKIKSYIFYILLGCQGACLLGIYTFSQKGLMSIQKARRENETIQKNIENLRGEISTIEEEIQDWHTKPYVIEKIAREQLQLAHQDDLVFMIQAKG